MQRLRLCYFGEGGSVHIHRWTAWFAARGHEVDLLSLRQATIAGVRVHVLPFGDRRGVRHFPAKVRQVRALVHGLGPDIVHGHQLLGYGLFAAASGFQPLVLSAWGSDVLVQPETSWLSRRVLGWMLPRAEAVISVAAHVDARAKRYGAPPSRTHIIPMGVDLKRWPLRTYRKGERDCLVISTRSLEPIYNVETFLRAIPSVATRARAIRYLVVGDGSERGQLEALAASLGIAPLVEFSGHRPPEELFAALQRSKLYVSTSLSDGASVSLLEGLSQGCFPIVSDIPANREWIRDGENGFLVPVRDPIALAGAIRRAAEDEDLLEKASVLNTRLVAERGDLDVNLQKVERIYLSLLSRSDSHHPPRAPK